MRGAQIGTMLFIAIPFVLRAEMPPLIHQGVLDGLRWYFHWMQPLPNHASNLDCRGVGLHNSHFVYCTPGNLTLEFADSPRNLPNVHFITTTPEPYSKAVNEFRAIHEASIRQMFQTSVRVSEIAEYHVSEERSKKGMEATRPFMASTLHGPRSDTRRGVRWLFPLISDGDPCYQVYLTVDRHVESIWEFPVIDGIVQSIDRWVYDQAHHNLPASAQSFSEDSSRWYSIISAENNAPGTRQ